MKKGQKMRLNNLYTSYWMLLMMVKLTGIVEFQAMFFIYSLNKWFDIIAVSWKYNVFANLLNPVENVHYMR